MKNLNIVNAVDEINEDEIKRKTLEIEPNADFTKETIRNLYRSTGGLCSKCGRPTIARDPSTEKFLCNGEAAHIFGKKRLAARHNELKTKEELKSFNNGIWLCRNCHYEIDHNHPKYPSDDLIDLKVDAEQRAYNLYMQNIDVIESSDYTKFDIDKFSVFQRCLIHYAIDKGYEKTSFDLEDYDYWNFEDIIFNIYDKRVPFKKRDKQFNWYDTWDEFQKYQFGSSNEACFSIDSEVLRLIIIRDYSYLSEESDVITGISDIFKDINFKDKESVSIVSEKLDNEYEKECENIVDKFIKFVEKNLSL